MGFEENLTWLKTSGDASGFSITVNVTEQCNLDCVYCYEHSKYAHSKKGRDFDLEAVLKKLDEILEGLRGRSRVGISFCGGEPLLAFENIKIIFNHVVKNYIRDESWDVPVGFDLTTNGTILTTEMRDWFEQHPCFGIGISMDGTPEAHNRNRSDSYDRLAKNLAFFKRYGNPVKMTIGPDTLADVAAGIKHITSLGLETTSNVIFEDVWGNDKEQQKHLIVFAEQLSDLIDYYSNNPDLPRTNLVRPLIECLPINEESEVRRYCGSGTHMAVIDVDGRDYPCHRFAPMSCKRDPDGISFDDVSFKPEKCANCPLVSMCPTCYAHNFECHGDLDRRTTFHCAFFKLQVRSAASLIFRDIERLREDVKITSLPHEQKSELSKKLQAALYVEEFTRPFYESLYKTDGLVDCS